MSVRIKTGPQRWGVLPTVPLSDLRLVHRYTEWSRNPRFWYSDMGLASNGLMSQMDESPANERYRRERLAYSVSDQGWVIRVRVIDRLWRDWIPYLHIIGFVNQAKINEHSTSRHLRNQSIVNIRGNKMDKIVISIFRRVMSSTRSYKVARRWFLTCSSHKHTPQSDSIPLLYNRNASVKVL